MLRGSSFADLIEEDFEEALRKSNDWQDVRQKRRGQIAKIVRPSGFLSYLLDTNISFLYRLPNCVFGKFPLYTVGLISRQNFFLIGLAVLLIKLTLLISLMIYQSVKKAFKRNRPHPWAYTENETAELDSLLNDWQSQILGLSSGQIMFGCQLALTLLLALLTSFAVSGRVPANLMKRLSKLAKFANFLSLLVSLFHILQLVLPVPFIAQLAQLKVSELHSAGLANTTEDNLRVFYYNRERAKAGQGVGKSRKPMSPSFIDKVQFNEKCCGLRSKDDWLEFAADQLAAYAEFLSERPGQLPPQFHNRLPVSCHDPTTDLQYTSACAPAIASQFLTNEDELLPLSVAALLSLIAAYYLQRAFIAQDSLSGLDPEVLRLAGDVASVSSLTGGSLVADRQINTTVPLVSVPTRIVRPIFEQCPKVGECTADVVHARLGLNEPLSFKERTILACSPQFFPLCFSPESSAITSLLQVLVRAIWGVVIFFVFVTNFSRIFSKASPGGGAYSRLMTLATLVAFVFPVVVSYRFLLMTLLFIPSLFLDFGGGYIAGMIAEAVFNGPFQTLMQNLNQTQLSMQCFMMSGSDLAEAGMKLALKPFVNAAHEYMTTTLLLSFLFKRLNSSSKSLHHQYNGGSQPMMDDLMVSNADMDKNVYNEIGSPQNPDVMDPQLDQASRQADQVLEESEKEEEMAESRAIVAMNRRLERGKVVVRFAKKQFNKFTAALARARDKFKKIMKNKCKALLFDIVNKCHKVGNQLCGKLNGEVPWYMRLVNLVLKVFDCPAVRQKWDQSICEKVKPSDFIKKICIKYARSTSPLAGIGSEFKNAFRLIENLIHFVAVELGFTTVISRFMPNIGIDDIIAAMAAAAFMLIEAASISILSQFWVLINSMMIGAIIAETFIFIKRYNTDLSFCNHYVTQPLIDIDYRRKQTIIDPVTQRSRDSLLPFAGWEMREPVWLGEEHEEESLTYPEQVGLTVGEKAQIKRKFTADAGMLVIIGIIFLTNFFITAAIDTMNAGLPANLTFEGNSKLNITVHGLDASLAKRITFGVVRDLTQTAVVNSTVELEACKVITKRIDNEQLKTVIVMVLMKLCMNLLYGYMSRLRPYICALFYPEQQRRRTVALYNQLLRRRAKRQKTFKIQILHRILAERFNILPFGFVTRLRLKSPTWNSIFRSLPFMNGNVICLCCGDPGFEQFKLCLDCNGSYCTPCWYQLNSMCLLCILLFKRLALDYEEKRYKKRLAMQIESGVNQGT